jgi:twitching motility protein PilT
MLSGSLKAVISQRLFKKKGGGRVAAYEIMLSNSSIRNLIREDKIPQLNSIIEISKQSGMVTMKDAILFLLQRNLITQETAEDALLINE